MTSDRNIELLAQMIEVERGGQRVYEAAIQCAIEEELVEEWKKYLEQTRHHEEVLTELFETLGLDPEVETPGRKVVRFIGESLVKAIEMARDGGDPEAAQIVAAECVVHAETKDHMNWQLLGELAMKTKGDDGTAMRDAHGEVEDEEDEHLYHTTGWTRELWLEALGMPAVLPPPEEEKDVRSAIGAERARRSRKEML